MKYRRSPIEQHLLAMKNILIEDVKLLKKRRQNSDSRNREHIKWKINILQNFIVASMLNRRDMEPADEHFILVPDNNTTKKFKSKILKEIYRFFEEKESK